MRFVFFFLALCASLIGKPLNVEVKAKSAILMNAQTGAILYEKNIHAPCQPASTTKIATALYVLEKGCDLQQKMTVSAEALKGRTLKDKDHPYWLDSDGTLMYLKRGETLSLETLLHGLMLVSGNDAANVIAESVGGTISQFMEQLNGYLQTIGCQHTQFCNPHGMPHPNHITTAYDLALIAQRALKLPTFRKVISTLHYSKPKSNKQPAGEIKLKNPLLNPKSRYYYPKAIGGKTGQLTGTVAGSFQTTLVAGAEHNGRTLIAVLLGCEKGGARFEEARKLFETAFNETKEHRRLIGPENVFTKEVPGTKSTLKASLSQPLHIEYYPSEEPKCKAALHWNFERLPIRKGEKVGEVHILSESGQFLQKGDLLAAEDLKGTFYFVLKEKIKGIFH